MQARLHELLPVLETSETAPGEVMGHSDGGKLHLSDALLIRISKAVGPQRRTKPWKCREI